MTLGLGALAAAQFAGGLIDGIKTSNAFKQQAATYQQQARIYRQNAAQTRLIGAMNEDVLRSQNRATLSRSVAAAGEVGMADSPTLMSALATTASALEQNVLYRRYQTESEAENYLYQARVADTQARALKKRAGHVFRNALISGISSALSVSMLPQR